jgi:transposase InsO family protein
LRQSLSRPRQCLDNAVPESFFGISYSLSP